VWTVRVEDGRVDVEVGEPAAAAASLRTDPATLNALLTDPGTFDGAVSDGRIEAGGEVTALRGLLRPSD